MATKRKKKITLTVAEKRILEHPPTKEAWYCKHKDEEGVYYKVYNSRLSPTCTLCGKNKPAKPSRPWTEYVAACDKVGIDSEEHFRYKVVNTVPMVRKKGESWKTLERD